MRENIIQRLTDCYVNDVGDLARRRDADIANRYFYSQVISIQRLAFAKMGTIISLKAPTYDDINIITMNGLRNESVYLHYNARINRMNQEYIYCL